jgi:proline iminopeptidase
VSCTMTRPCDVHWLCREAGRFFPRQWQRYREGGGNSGDLVTACGKLLSAHPIPLSGNARPGTGATGRTRPAPWKEGRAPGERFTGPRFRMIFARLCAHYFSHAAWLPDGQQLLRDARRLAGIPGVMIHGRFGVQGPADVPWLLHQAWPGSELHLVGTGHQGGEEMTAHVMAALSHFART